ncbi:MAG: hypothetical protein ACE5IY_22900 [bacterium]
MSGLNKIATFQNRRDEVPNQELAKRLAETKDKKGIREIAENLWHENKNVQSDCLKVLYEIGYLQPELIADHVGDFLRLLNCKNNRLVWGSMIALSTIAEIKAEDIFQYDNEIKKALETGSVITVDNGVKTLAIIASTKDEHRKKIFPYLLKHLGTCRPKEVPQHSEKILVAVNAKNKREFIDLLEKRMPDLRGSQVKRVNRVIKKAEKC